MVLPLVSLAWRAVVLLDATVIPPGFLLVNPWLTSMLVPSPKPFLFCLLSKILLVDCQFLLLNLVRSPSQKKKIRQAVGAVLCLIAFSFGISIPGILF